MADEMEPNDRMRAARERTPSPLIPGDSMSRREVAEAVNAWLWATTRKRYELDAHVIARYERGAVRWPGAHYRAGLRHVLGADSDAELGFAPASGNRSVAAVREFAVSLDGVDLGVSPAEYVQRISLDMPTPSRVGQTEIGQVRTTTRALALAENAHGGALAGDCGVAQLRWATRLLDARCSLRPALLEAVGNLAGVVAFAAFDSGKHKAAADSFRYSLWCAEQGDSWELRAAVLADMARQACYLGEPDKALTLVEQACVRVDRLSATGLAMVQIVRARLLALVGRTGDARAQVALADENFVRNNPTNDPPWLAYYDQAEHSGCSARALIPTAIERREPGEAAARLTAAIRLHTDAYPRSRAFSRTRLAVLMMKAGDPREAVSTGRVALAEVIALRSRRLDDELKALHRAALAHTKIAEVADFVRELTMEGAAER